MSEKVLKETSIIKDEKTFFDIVIDRASDNEDDKSFKEIFGDLSDFDFSGDLRLAGLNLNSLSGCPHSVSNGYFSIDDNPKLHSLEYFPRIFASDQSHSVYIDSQCVKEFANIPIGYYKHSRDICIRATAECHPEDLDLVLSFLKFRGIREDFYSICAFNKDQDGDFSLDYDRLEFLYNTYEKVGFSAEKLKRFVELT